MFDGQYTISANDNGYYISGTFTTNTWQNDYSPTSGKPEPNYYVYSKGNLYNFTLAGSAKAYVSSGGQATNIQVSSGGQLSLSGGTLTSATIAENGQLYISGGTITSLTILKGGKLYDQCQGKTSQFVQVTKLKTLTKIVSGGAMCDGRYAVQGTSATISGSHNISAGFLTLQNGASATNLKVAEAGSLTVSGSAKAANTVINGALIVLNKGSATNARIVKGRAVVKSGGTLNNTKVSSGGQSTVNGTALNTRVLASGHEIVISGLASKTVISYGGSQTVGRGGITSATEVLGLLHLSSGGIASKVQVKGGTMLLGMVGIYSGRASAVDTTISKGVMSAVTNKSYTWNTKISQGAVQHLSGAIDSKATIYGSQVLHGGKALGATVKAGGKQIVRDGLASGTKVEAKGILSSIVSGVTKNTIISGKAFISANYQVASDYKAKIYGVQTVYSGAIAISATIYKGGSQLISAGTASGTVIASGGSQIIKGGGTHNANVKSGGTLNIVSGVGTATTIASGGKVIAGKAGSFDQVKINKGGLLTVKSGGWITSATINANGKVVINSGGSANFLYAQKGAIISGGTTSNKITVTQVFGLSGNVQAKNFHAVTIKVGGLKIAVAGANNTLGSFKDSVDSLYLQVSDTYRTRLNFDLRTAKIGSNMLTLSNTSKLRCICTIQTAKNQSLGTYKLAKGLNLTLGPKDNLNSITIKVGSTSFSTKTGQTIKKNGMQYAVSLENNQLNLAIGLVYGSKIFKGTSGKDTLQGTVNSEIFYGGSGNDSINGKNGRDVAVYDTTKWGADTIAKTNGTLTLLFNGLKKSDIKTSLKNGTQTITRAQDSKQKITISGWSDATHKIVYTSGLTKFKQYLSATKPSTELTTAARNEAFKKAGLASV